MPSQALPRQLPQRGSQAVKFITKVLGAMRKFPAVLLALPLGELSPQVTERACKANGCCPSSGAALYYYIIQAEQIPTGYRRRLILPAGKQIALSRLSVQNFVPKNIHDFWRLLQNAKYSGILLDLPLDNDKIELHSVCWISLCADGYLLW